MKEPNRVSDRLGANRRIKSHRIAGRCSDARTEGGRVEGLRFAVDEQSRPLRPEQDERTFFRADVVRVEARRGEVGNRPCMVGARVDHGFDRGRRPGLERTESVQHVPGDSLHKRISRLQRIVDNNAAYVEPHDMLAELRGDNAILTRSMREVHSLCDKAGDVATASLLENWIDETEKRIWFLFECGQHA